MGRSKITYYLAIVGKFDLKLGRSKILGACSAGRVHLAELNRQPIRARQRQHFQQIRAFQNFQQIRAFQNFQQIRAFQNFQQIRAFHDFPKLEH